MSNSSAVRSLTIAVPPGTRELPPDSGAGKVWHHVLEGLSGQAHVIHRKPSTPLRSVFRRRPDIWLSDGHQGPLPFHRTVVQLHEACWKDPDLRALMDPTFVSMLEDASAAAARAASRIVTPSRCAREQVITSYGVEPDKVHAVHHGVDHGVYHPGLPGGTELIARSGGDRNRPYVLFVSVVHPRKNLSALRAAMASLAAQGFPHQLALVAAPAADRPDSTDLQREAFAELPGAPGRVVPLPRLTEAEMAAVMAGAAAFCLPSLMEGFGLPVLEAMACGVPVVVSDRGALPEVVGGAGVVVEPTASAIESGLASILADPDHGAAVGMAGRERSREFTWESTVQGWRAAIDAAVRG